MSPPLAPGSYIVSIAPWDDVTGAFCPAEAEFKIGSSQGGPCAIRTDRGDIPVRVGPGPDRAVFTFLPSGTDILVIGQAIGSDGNLWWEIDRSQIPGGGGAESLWVAQSDAVTSGDCTQVPETDIPDVVIPDDPDEPPPGGWGPCGSCDTCGHPASECVTSPEGVCLWDPATCVETPPDTGGECYVVTTRVIGTCGGTVSIATPSNCEGGGYTPGTTVQAFGNPADPKCQIVAWTGCGASGSGFAVTFTPPGSCTLTAEIN
jgi:hypothetical protein